MQERKRAGATKTINLLLGGAALANYDPVTGAGFSTSGGLPIQTPVSPNGSTSSRPPR